MKPLTAADLAALKNLPQEGWFDVRHASINRPSYRCERLEAAGQLERRTVRDAELAALGTDALGCFKTQYRRKGVKAK